MSEDITNDPLLEKLARFTPAGAGLDRDALIFAAGRASASRNRGWKLATMVLAAAQAATIVVWLAGAQTRIASDGAATSQAQPPDMAPLPSLGAPESVASGSYARLILSLDQGELPPVQPFQDASPAVPIMTASDRDVPGFE